MNMFFSDRKTIEFRMHHATLNHHKMIPWLFICNAIVRYAENNAQSILKSGDPIALTEIADFYGNLHKTKDAKFLSSYLKAYIASRKAYFEKDRQNGDYQSLTELAQDNKFTFTHENVTGLV